MPAPKKIETPATTGKAAPVANETLTAPADPNVDLLNVLHQVKAMSEVADQTAVTLVAHERRFSRIDHGHFDGDGYASAKTTADDPVIPSRLRTLASACTEFAMAIRRSCQ